MLRTEALEALARYRKDMFALVTMRAVEPWEALGESDRRTYNVMGCMGAAASIGLGLAIAQPTERVLVIDGDGSLLMQLGSLVSIASNGPRNLYHVVMENGTYETSGGQAIPGVGRSDLPQIALASGYAHAVRLSSIEDIDARLPVCLELDGPVFVSLAISGPGAVNTPPRRPGGPSGLERLRSQMESIREEMSR